ncbi:hypothetical protein [Dyadobacter sp. CY351]|uniref:hypothetical protein n=1 Tax=Dyadobacter sp. CY351 TaxID=2909337 RepID=UPI001F261A95|nr:hypothetical protein [Dyadobacter sp. CY351]MCF2516448.1 hypothetical protein [Dyadobacter sp. CY351]
MINTLKREVVKLAEKSKLFRKIYCQYKRSKSINFPALAESRRSADIFDLEQLSSPLPYYPLFYFDDCNYYGILCRLLEYSNIKVGNARLPLHEIYLEHGIVIGSVVRADSVKLAKTTLTYSSYREKYIAEKAKKTSISIGPYIHYAESLLNQRDLDDLKKQLGRVLLVFPSHSIGAVLSEYDQHEFCNEIEKRKVGFDTVLVCMYWKDVQNGDHEAYKKMGYKLTTAGHRDDLYFLNRLKSIIMLSDMVISNSTGTHVGYSIYLNKPNYLFKQNVAFVAVSKSGESLVKNHYMPDVTATKDRDNQMLYDAFNVFQDQITDDQYKLTNYIWGFDCVKTPEELKAILFG